MASIKSSSSSGWKTCGAVGLYFLYTFIQMNFLNSLGTDIKASLKINSLQLTMLSSSFFLSAAICFFPIGIILDWLSLRKIMLFGILVSAMAFLLFSMQTHLYTACLARIFMGLSYSIALLGCFKLAINSYEERQATAVGMITAMGLLGGIIAQAPTIFLNSLIGWRYTLLVYCIVGLIILWAGYSFIDDSANINHKSSCNHSVKILDFKKSIEIISNYKIWLCTFFICFINLPIDLFGSLWGNVFLTNVFKVDALNAATVCSLMFLGLIAGCPLIGWLSDRYFQKITCAKSSLILTVIISLPLFFMHNLPLFVIDSIFFGFGFFAGSQALGLICVAETYSDRIGINVGLITTFTVFGNAILQYLFNWLLDLSWKPNIVNGLVTPSHENYLLAFSIFPIGNLISVILIPYLNSNLPHTKMHSPIPQI